MITVREATAADIELLQPLVAEMQDHYEGPGVVSGDDVRLRLREAMSRLPDGIVLIALETDPVGVATLYEMFPGRHAGTMWYLKEIYVAQAARGKGVGDMLMQASARAVIDRGGSRIEFTTGSDNEGAQRFYERLGAEVIPKVFYRFDDEALSKLAGSADED